MVLGRPLERLREGSGGYRSPEAQQIERMLDAGTSRLNLTTWPNNPKKARTSYVDDAVQAVRGGHCNIRDEVVPLD